MSNQDLEHLKLLAIFHYVLGGLIAFYSCFPALYVGFGVLMIVAPQTLTGGRGEAPPPAVGWILVVIGVVFVILGWAMAICLVVTGRYLARQKHRLFCLIVAGLSCLNMPLGTILGVFTIIVLIRPSVKELFEGPVDVVSTGD